MSKDKNGALAGTIREFETLREFFNSSTLVVLIDLPFVFFFIYIISLIAGPLSYVFPNSRPISNYCRRWFNLFSQVLREDLLQVA